jgi:bifunctional non-homologous end joining protein LigD
MALREYRKKRDFRRTPEPAPRAVARKKGAARAYVIQKHDASRLHYDFRLEHDGVLKSWAVPKGPSLDPADKRLAVQVEDHPLDYGGFEGVIPEGEYGAGPVLLWDRGRWIPKGDVDAGLRKGHLEFELEGEKLEGAWFLVRLGGARGNGKDWLLIKRHDGAARVNGRSIVDKLPKSVASGRAIGQIAEKKRGASAKLPAFVEPELATLVDAAPKGDDWFHEIKYDGYRMLARLERGSVRWITRNGLDWTKRFASLSPAIAALSVQSALFDGEVVVEREDGTTDFQDLQNAFRGAGSASLRYRVFDLLHFDGLDLRPAALEERKKALHRVLGRARGPVRFGDHVTGEGPAFHARACKLGLEGIVSKRRGSPYRSGRGRDWLKVKCGKSQEVVVVGYTEPSGARVGIGALVVGVHEKKRLRYAGRVGTGFDERTLRSLKKSLAALEVPSPPFDVPVPRAVVRGVHWVEPRLVANVRFTGWTSDGVLRHPTFQGLREDKPASAVVYERPQKTPKTPTTVAGIEITHPDRVLYPGTEITKLDLARFYERIAPRILPHVVDRPLSIVRCPSGQGGQCFFQKHEHGNFPDAVGSVKVKEKQGPGRYLTIDAAAGLVALVQMGALELHPWGSRNDRLEFPDQVIFDVDPAPDVGWDAVAEAARTLHAFLGELDLEAFLKTTGGKGLHVVVPLDRKEDWDEVKAFSHAVALRFAKADPKRFLATASKAQRKGKIFVDYLRNARGATAVAAYSTRARPGAPVATPVAWSELDGSLRSDTYTVENLEERLGKRRRDPWEEFFRVRQGLARARKRLGI